MEQNHRYLGCKLFINLSEIVYLTKDIVFSTTLVETVSLGCVLYKLQISVEFDQICIPAMYENPSTKPTLTRITLIYELV